jgi:hypothetical protein
MRRDIATWAGGIHDTLRCGSEESMATIAIVAVVAGLRRCARARVGAHIVGVTVARHDS